MRLCPLLVFGVDEVAECVYVGVYVLVCFTQTLEHIPILALHAVQVLCTVLRHDSRCPCVSCDAPSLW